MAYHDNKDILSWKRLIQNLQNKTDEGVEQYNKAQNRAQLRNIQEGGVHKLRVDQQTHITAEHHDVVVSSNDMGIIVDIYDKKSDNIDTNTYWNDDVMEEAKEKVTEGTWSIPDTPEKVKELKDLMKQELPAAGAHDKIYHLLGDDELFDELDAMEEKDPKADVRGMIVRRLDDLGLLKKKEDKETVNEDHNISIDLLRNVARQMEKDAHIGDYTAIEELLQNVSEEELKAFLSDHRSPDWTEESVEVTEDKVFKVKDIEWDTEDSTGEGPEGLDLPTSLTVSVPKEHLGSYEDTEEFISDFISNVTGFTHKGYRTNPDI